MAQTFNILITGGAGYLGSVLTPTLLEYGHRVTVLDNFLFGQNSLQAVCASTKFDVVNGDARREEILAPLVKNADIVIPLAALVGAPMCDKNPMDALSVNKNAITTLLGMMSPAQRLIMPITNSGYGIGEPGKYCTEETPLRPISLYGRLKVEAEAEALEREHSISFRLATVFGMSPRMRTDLLVNDFVFRALNDRALILFESHFKRNYIHVQDVARVFLHAIDHFDTMKGEPYNVGLSDANLSKFELCEKIKQHIPNFVVVDAPIGEDLDKRDYIVSNEKIEAQGYTPAFSLDDGIIELIKGYRMIPKSICGNV
jgi:nucleoside-diphosphate-sugar epimerase